MKANEEVRPQKSLFLDFNAPSTAFASPQDEHQKNINTF